MLHARCPDVPRGQVDHAIGLALSWERLTRDGERFQRGGRRWAEFSTLKATPLQSKTIAHAVELLPFVRDVFAKRAGTHAPTEAPAERFHTFLTKQGWTGLATWWAMNIREMRALTEATHPAAICVLCGALLEGALVAISEPAIKAQQWNQKFTQKPAEAWRLSELIDQAEASKVFNSAQRALAEVLAAQRNRIHVGRFHQTDRFNPPYTNQHEARSARDSLSTLLDAILEWPTVKALR
jgi:hypothetical protein